MHLYKREHLILLLLIAIALQPLIAKSQMKSPIDVTIDKQGIKLKGTFYVSEKEGRFPTLILLQGFGSSNSDVLGLGKQLVQSGINVLTFINSGITPSEGLFSFSNSLTDIHAAYTFIHDLKNVARFKIDTASIILGGVSFGGGIAMTYAIKHPEITHVISISGNDWGEYIEEYASNPDMKARVDGNVNRAITSGLMKFEPGGQPTEMVEAGLNKIDPDLYLKKNAKVLAPKDILLICGWNDNVVSIDRYVLPLYRELQKKNATQVRIEAFQDDHGYSKSRNELAEVIGSWIKNILKL